jgi:hypothetical protein
MTKSSRLIDECTRGRRGRELAFHSPAGHSNAPTRVLVASNESRMEANRAMMTDEYLNILFAVAGFLSVETQPCENDGHFLLKVAG